MSENQTVEKARIEAMAFSLFCICKAEENLGEMELPSEKALAALAAAVAIEPAPDAIEKALTTHSVLSQQISLWQGASADARARFRSHAKILASAFEIKKEKQAQVLLRLLTFVPSVRAYEA